MTTTTVDAAPLASLAAVIKAGALDDLTPAITAEAYAEGAERLLSLSEFHADGIAASPADLANLLAGLADGTLILPCYEDFVVTWRKGGEARVALVQSAPSGDAIELSGVIYERGADGSWTFRFGGFNVDGDHVSAAEGSEEDVEAFLGWLASASVGVREDLARARERGEIVERQAGRMPGHPVGAAMLRDLPWNHVADEVVSDTGAERVIRSLRRGEPHIPRHDFCLSWCDSFGEAYCAEVLVTPRGDRGVSLNIIAHHRLAIGDWRYIVEGEDFDGDGWVHGSRGDNYTIRVVLAHLDRLARRARSLRRKVS